MHSRVKAMPLSVCLSVCLCLLCVSLGPRPNQPQHRSLLVSRAGKRYTRWINGLGTRLVVCLCLSPRNTEAKQARQSIYRRYSLLNNEQNHTVTFLYLIQVKLFMPVFQLLPIISFLAPPLLKSHMVVPFFVVSCSVIV